MDEKINIPNYELAFKDYQKGLKYKEIAEKYDVSVSAVKSWSSRYWRKKQDGCNPERSQPKKVATKGGQAGNKNAVGNSGGAAPLGNRNAEKYGFFSKYLPDETREIFWAIEQADPLDLLWHQIQLAYAAIIRAQRIAYVKDRDDKTKEKIMSGETSDMYSVQQAWDKQNEFMKAQARAQGELRSLIKQYDEMLHKDWGMATEEQRSRIAQIKAQTDKLTGNNQEIEDMSESEAEIYGVHEETDA